MASAGIIFCPKISESSQGTPIEEKIESLLAYRGAWKKLKKSKGATSYRYLSNRGGMSEFNFGEFPGDEIGKLVKLSKMFGGEYLLVWSYGHLVHHFFVRSPEVGKEPLATEVSFRLNRHGFQRDASIIEEFLGWFDDGIKVDAAVLEKELLGDSIRLSSWFSAIGIPGAREFDTSEPEAIWAEFETLAHTLLSGESAEVSAVKNINAEIRLMDDEAVLKSKPSKRIGTTSYKISQAAYVLSEALGSSQNPLWKERTRAASFYWDITDCKDSSNRLLGGDEKKAIGLSAAFGRLMLHYPKNLRRDGIFWSLAGAEAESANGHCYVESFNAFAETCAKSGFILVVAEGKSLESFREKFGLYTFDGETTCNEDWFSEVFVDLGSLQKKDPLPILQTWFSKEKISGLVFSAKADGTWALECFQDGESTPKSPMKITNTNSKKKELTRASLELDPEKVLSILKLPNFLEPGEWTEGTYAGLNCDADADLEMRSQTEKLTEEAKRTLKIPHTRYLFAAPTEDIFSDWHQQERSHSVSAFSVSLPSSNEKVLRELRKDFKQDGLLESSGEIWTEENNIFAFGSSPIGQWLFIRALGDLPDGTRISMRTPNEHCWSYQIQGDIAAPDENDWKQFFPELEQPCEIESEDGEEVDEEYDLLERELEFSSRLQEGIDDESLVHEIVLEVPSRKYFSLNLEKLEPLKKETLAPAETAFLEASFIKLGDLYSAELGDVVYRGFSKPEDIAFGSVTILPFGEPFLELYTRFSKGYSITTTTNQFVRDNPDAGIFFKSLPAETTFTELLEAHLKAIGEAYETYGKPQKVVATLESYAQAIEEFAQRSMGN